MQVKINYIVRRVKNIRNVVALYNLNKSATKMDNDILAAIRKQHNGVAYNRMETF